MYSSCIAKQEKLKKLFADCQTLDDRYQMIIDLGKAMPPLAPIYKVAENLVKGCQSQMYLRSYISDDGIIFEGQSDALISQGLGALLIQVYSGESPETILKCPPTYIEELQIAASLSPSRSNGLYSIHLRMKQEALKLLTKT